MDMISQTVPKLSQARQCESGGSLGLRWNSVEKWWREVTCSKQVSTSTIRSFKTEKCLSVMLTVLCVCQGQQGEKLKVRLVCFWERSLVSCTIMTPARVRTLTCNSDCISTFSLKKSCDVSFCADFLRMTSLQLAVYLCVAVWCLLWMITAYRQVSQIYNSSVEVSEVWWLPVSHEYLQSNFQIWIKMK